MTRKRHLVWLASCIGAMALVHCSGDEDAPPSSSPATADGSADASPAPDTVSPDAGAEASLDGAADASPPPPVCVQAERGSVIGTIDGGAFSEPWEISSSALVPGDPWRISNALKGAGVEFFRGAGAGTPPIFDAGEHPFDIGFARAPASSALAGAVLCLDDGVAERVDGVVTLRTRTGSVLGQCPGATPVGGEQKICPSNQPLCTPQGALTGVTLDTTNVTISSDTVDAPPFRVNARGSHMVLFGFSDTLPSGGSAALSGVFATLPQGGGVGTIYCLGTGSEVHWATAEGSFVVVKNASKLGDCGGSAPPGTDAIRVCR